MPLFRDLAHFTKDGPPSMSGRLPYLPWEKHHTTGPPTVRGAALLNDVWQRPLLLTTLPSGSAVAPADGLTRSLACGA